MPVLANFPSSPNNSLTAEELKEILADEYISKNQGSANVGKILCVGTDGNLTLIDMPESGASGDVIGTIDGNNNILLTGYLADGTYTLKYENEDGTYAEIGTLKVGAISEPESVINLIPTLTDTDLTTIYNGIGYKEHTRISISGGGAVTHTDTTLTGLIPVGTDGDILHFRGIEDIGNNTAHEYDGTFWCYNANGELITSKMTSIPSSAISADENGDFTITLSSSWLVDGTAYVRFNVGVVTDEFIMTRNQLIPVE